MKLTQEVKKQIHDFLYKKMKLWKVESIERYIFTIDVSSMYEDTGEVEYTTLPLEENGETVGFYIVESVLNGEIRHESIVDSYYFSEEEMEKIRANIARINELKPFKKAM